MCRETNEFGNDKVEITLKGSAFAIGNILTGNVTRALEDKMDVQRELDRSREDRDSIQSKLWKAEDECSTAKEEQERLARLVHELNETITEQERLARLVYELNETITEQEKQIGTLRSEVMELRNQTAVAQTPDMLTKLAEARENVFQNLMADVTFPDNKPKPRTLGELMSFFVFPIFQAGRAPQGWSPGQPIGTSSGVTNKIAMIKQVRELTGAGLKEARDFVEGLGSGLLK